MTDCLSDHILEELMKQTSPRWSIPFGSSDKMVPVNEDFLRLMIVEIKDRRKQWDRVLEAAKVFQEIGLTGGLR